MAIINSYPKGTPKAEDLLIGTDVPQEYSGKEGVTKNFKITDIANLVISETSGITGAGTLNTIAMFTPTGSKIGDSLITQVALGQGINVDTNLDVTDDFTVDGSIQCNSALTVESTSTFNDDVTLGADTDDNIVVEGTIELQGPVKDNSANLPSSAGQILVGDAGGGVTWTDSTDIVSGAVAKLIPFQVTASAGGSSTYSANNNIVEIGWTGGNGTYVLNIPSAATIPYRNIRFVTNSTFPNGASDKVQITAQSGETIDGAAFFEISKIYEGVSLWSNGTEWIVIQSKAH